MNRYQGEDIPFSIKIWKDNKKTEAINIDNLAEVVIYIYTDGCKKAAFSKTIKDGYVQLGRNNEYEYFGIIDSSCSSLMSPGSMFMEINIAEDDTIVKKGIWNFIKRTTIGLLHKSTIKKESL